MKKVNESTQNWHQLENIGNFIKAITKYGVKPHDIFEANDLFENTNHTQVQSTLLALASMAKTKGNKVNVGVKYAEKQERRFEPEKLREGRNIIGLQVLTLPLRVSLLSGAGEVKEARRALRSLQTLGGGIFGLS